MNKSYLIVPAVLLAVFGFFYNGALKEMHAKEVARQEKLDREAAADKKRKQEVEDRAQKDAEKRLAERAAADKAKEEKKEKDYQDAMRKLKDEADDYANQTAKLLKESSETEAAITKGRADKERLNREALEISKQVEQAKINRRSAELEIQRMVDMVAQRLGASSLAQMPPPPAPTKK